MFSLSSAASSVIWFNCVQCRTCKGWIRLELKPIYFSRWLLWIEMSWKSHVTSPVTAQSSIPIFWFTQHNGLFPRSPTIIFRPSETPCMPAGKMRLGLWLTLHGQCSLWSIGYIGPLVPECTLHKEKSWMPFKIWKCIVLTLPARGYDGNGAGVFGFWFVPTAGNCTFALKQPHDHVFVMRWRIGRVPAFLQLFRDGSLVGFHISLYLWLSDEIWPSSPLLPKKTFLAAGKKN